MRIPHRVVCGETDPAQDGSLIPKNLTSGGLEEWPEEGTSLACAMIHAKESARVRVGLWWE